MIAAVVVTFSAPAELLDRCLRALRGHGGLDGIVLVDTGGAAEVAGDLLDAVQVIRMENRGYGAAANRGISALGWADRIAVLNDDVVVGADWLTPLVAALSAPGVGAAQPALVAADHDTVVSLGVVLDRHGAGCDVGDGGPMPVDRSERDIGIFTGGAVLFDADYLAATGGFDERYFLYYEDVDLALRGRALGWHYRLVPRSMVEHRRGLSTSAQRDETRFLQERNRIWTAFRFGSTTMVIRAVWLSVRRLRHEPASVHRRALAAGLGGAPRRIAERVAAARRTGDSIGSRPGTVTT